MGAPGDSNTAPLGAEEVSADRETMLVTTDSLEEFATEMSTSLGAGPVSLDQAASTIQLIQGDLQNGSANDDTATTSSDLTLSSALNDTSLNSTAESSQTEDYLHNADWLSKDKHVFILSSAGKPIYSRYGNEDKLAALCGVIQALVSFVNNSNEDTIRSIHTPSCLVVFLIKGPLIIAAVSKLNENETQLVLQLTYVFNQIVSVLTLTQLNRIFEKKSNYDLRRLLSGVERLIDHLITFMEKDPAFLLGAVRCLPMAPNMRDSIANAIISACSKIKDLVFAILIAGNQLITLVRMKKYTLHPSDIHLVVNLVKCTESFKTAESWTPLCLPKFDSSGFLHGHVSYLSDDCQACLLLMTVKHDAFFELSEAKKAITEKLRRTNCLEAINDALLGKNSSTSKPLKQIAVPEMRHFIYKCRTNAQLFSSDNIDEKPRVRLDDHELRIKTSESPQGKISSNKIVLPNFLNSTSENLNMDNWRLPEINYLNNYRKMCGQIHCSDRPAKLIYKLNSEHTILAWVTAGFELYVTFDPLIEKNSAIAAVDKLLKWIKKEEDRIFIMNAPTF